MTQTKISDLRKDLFDVADKHIDNPRLLQETFLLAATTCLSCGMTPELSNRAFNEILADVFRAISHQDLSPLAQVVRDEA